MSYHYVVFDIETRMRADEVEGGFAGLRQGKGGISAIAVWDSKRNRVFLYDDHTVRGCAHHLEEADLVVGYNSDSFDVPAIEGLLGRKLHLKHHLDLYSAVKAALKVARVAQPRGNKLDDLARRTIGRGKTGEGALAPDLAKQGRFAELFQYCCDDTYLTLDLFRHALKHRGVVDVNGRFLPLALPAWILPKETDGPELQPTEG